MPLATRLFARAGRFARPMAKKLRIVYYDGGGWREIKLGTEKVGKMSQLSEVTDDGQKLNDACVIFGERRRSDVADEIKEYKLEMWGRCEVYELNTR